MTPHRYLNVRAAAQYLDRSPSSLYHLVARGRIPSLRQGRRIFFDRVDLDHWMRGSSQREGVDASAS